jgi:hypothetical protein
MELFRPPVFNRQVACIAEDARLAATVSSLVGEEGEYICVLQGPRMGRLDKDNEVIRRCTGIAKLWPSLVLLAGLGEEAEAGFRSILPKGIISSVKTVHDAISLLAAVNRRALAGELRCRTSEMGLGLLWAKRQRKLLILDDAAPALQFSIIPPADHLVVLDDHDPIVQVIAANYAYSIGADLALIPERDDTLREQVYAELDQRVAFRGEARGQRSQRSLVALQATIEPTLRFGPREFVTFITKGFPYGYFYHDAPSTHLFSEPQLGELINAGIYWARAEPYLTAAVLIDPGHLPGSETRVVGRTLDSEGVIVFSVLDDKANVENTRLFIEAFPYDLLFICSHCGEVEGEQLTMRVPDRNGVAHVIEVDEAVQFGSVAFGSQPSKNVQVHQLLRPVSIDGTDWHAAGPDVKKHYAAIWDYLLHAPREKWEILRREKVKHVPHSTAIQLNQGALMLSLINVIDARVSPIIFNNSCVSFYDAAHALTFAGARSYVGTLAPVQDRAARRLAEIIFAGGERTISLPLALHTAQAQVFANHEERTYIHVGCHFTSLRTPRAIASATVQRRLVEAKAHWLSRTKKVDADKRENILAFIRFLSMFTG